MVGVQSHYRELWRCGPLIAFKTQMEGWKMLESPESKTLRGGGIEAQVLIVSMDSFKVTGQVNDLKERE
jgi:hypothetical protein